MFVVWYLIMIAALAAFVAMHAWIMPRLFFNFRYEVKKPTGRGVKVIDDGSDRAIVYDSDYPIRKYMPQYAIRERAGTKSLICRTDDRIGYVEYDVVLFDRFNQVKDTLRVREVISERGHTQELELPADTAYACVNLNAADGRAVPGKNRSQKTAGLCWAAFLFSCAVVETLTAFIIRICLARLYGGLFGDIFLYSMWSNIVAGALCVMVIALNVLIMALFVRRRANEMKDQMQSGAGE